MYKGKKESICLRMVSNVEIGLRKKVYDKCGIQGCMDVKRRQFENF